MVTQALSNLPAASSALFADLRGDLAFQVETLLDRTICAIARRESVSRSMTAMIESLDRLRQRASLAQWERLIRDVCRPHPLYELLALDPFTARARAQPRGYAGDAEMIDFIYRGLPEAVWDTTTAIGREIFTYTAISSPSAHSVRHRRDLLASKIDAVAARVKQPRILSIACGHLREALLSRSVLAGDVGTLTALDQDTVSLAVVANDLAHVPAVETLHRSVRDLIAGKCSLSNYDFIYAAGLFDYLPDRAARDLVRVLAASLAPGGQLLIGNFVTDFSGASYIEAFMEWPLICRTIDDLYALCSGIPAEQIARLDDFIDPSGSVAYLTITRG